MTKLSLLVLSICTISPARAQADDQPPLEQPAVMTRFGNGGGAPALIFPQPRENLPNPAQMAISGLPGTWPLSLAFCGPDRVMMVERKTERASAHTSKHTALVSVVDLASGARAGTIDIPGYPGMGTIAAPPSYNVVLASSGITDWGYDHQENEGTDVLHVLRPPFGSGGTTKTRLPGFVFPYQQNAIAFDRKTERAFVYHSGSVHSNTGGIAVLDPPYTRVAFTIPLEMTGGDVVLTPDGKTLLVTGYNYDDIGPQTVKIFHAPFSPSSRPAKLPITSENTLHGLSVTPDGTTAIVTGQGGYDGGRKAWAISAPFDSNSRVDELPLPPATTTYPDAFRSVDISPDGQLAILTGGDTNDGEPAVFIRAPFTAAGATAYNVPVEGGRANGAVRFRHSGTVFAISVPEGTYTPGDLFLATVKLEYGGSKTLTVTFEEPLLAADDPAILEVEAVEVPPPVVLKPGSSTATFTVPVRAGKNGVAELLSRAVFAEEEGPTETREAVREVVVSPLGITITAKPLVNGRPIVNMKLGDDGKVTDAEGNQISPKVEVTIANKSDQPISAVLQGVDPRARDRSALAGRINVTGEFPADLGTIPANGSVTKEYDLQIVDDGRFEFSALVTALAANSTKGITAVGRGAPVAVGVPYPVELALDFAPSSTITRQNNGAFFLQPGGDLMVIASVKNLTSNSSLEFFGIRAQKEQNAFGAVLTSDDGNLTQPPFPHDYSKHNGNQVNAGAAAVLSGKILTEDKGFAHGTVTWIGLEHAFLIDDATGEKTAVEPDDVLVTSTHGGWLGNDLAVRVIQDRSRPPVPPRTAYQMFEGWSVGVLDGVGTWTCDTFDAIGGLGRLAGAVSADPSLLSEAMGTASRAVWETAEMVHFTWQNMTPEEREAFIRSITEEVKKRNYFLAPSRQGFQDAADAYQFTKDATYSLFGGVEAAYASDDPVQITQMWGRVSGNIGMEVVTAAIPTAKFTRYSSAAQAARLADNTAETAAQTLQEAALRVMQSGPVPPNFAQKFFGLSGDELSNVQATFKALGVRGYARERSPEATRLIEELVEAVWKPEAMKPKGFLDLDLLLLGDNLPVLRGKPPGNQPINLKGITGIFYPESDSVLRARFANESPEMVEAIIARAKFRRAEYIKHRAKFAQWSKPVADGGGIPVKFNYKDNGAVPPDDAGAAANRAFSYDTLSSSNAVEILIPRMANSGGELRLITGDVDWVHFTHENGMALDPVTAGLLYKAMAPFGLQHGDTISWLQNGQAIFKGKINQLVDYISGQKALLEVSADNLRAVRINPNQSRLAHTGREHLIHFDGGTKEVIDAVKGADLENAFAVLMKSLPSRPVLLPFLWSQRWGGPADPDTTIEGKDWTYSADEDAVVVRQQFDGSLEYFVNGSWLPWQIPTPQPGADRMQFRASAGPLNNAGAGVLKLAPLTITEAPMAVGATTVPLLPINEHWAAQLAGHLDHWFSVDDLIVIAPGTAKEETRRVTAVNPLRVGEPLRFAHPEQTIVAVLPQAPNSTPTPTPTATALPTISPTPTATVTPTPAPTASPTPTSSATPTPEPTASPTPTATTTAALLNISTRLNVQTGENVLIGGIIITGTEPKKVILRAIGPSLAAAVDGALQDPVLELFDGAGEPVTSNDNWRDTDESEINASTIPPDHEAESAIVRTLDPGNYTAIVRGKGDTTGIGLVEVYDLAQGASSQLANISSRGFVDTGANALIGGFITGGTAGGTPAKVIVRALGPSLGDAGVSGALADPNLELIDANGFTVRANDDWKASQQIELEALGIQPARDEEAALIATLPPGNYTAVVRGTGDTTGVGLVEVYNVQ